LNASSWPFGEAFESRTLDLADVDEYVLTALVALDEAEALLRVEEFDLALAGADNLGRHSAATAAARAPAAAIAAEAAARVRRRSRRRAGLRIRPAEAVAAAAPVIPAEAGRAAFRERVEPSSRNRPACRAPGRDDLCRNP
jgi:hypothetical protein